jgi:DNA mismatch repair protein MutL
VFLRQPLLTIHPLSTDLVHLIAAGEVIDSLAAAARELIDNALDAGATRITVTVWPAQWRIQVADNGTGMSQQDLQQAVTPHSTSKIQTPDDLWNIRTLGFRGEALHSLAQLGTLELRSRPAAAEQGWHFIYGPQGQPIHTQEMAISPGTIATVNQLFSQWSARRQSLPSPAQQLRAVQAVIHHSALCHPEVTWTVEHSDRPWFQIAPGSSAKEILLQILPTLEPSDLRAIKHQELELVVGLPDRCHRPRPDWLRVAVNGRCVRVEGGAGQVGGLRASSELEQSILQAFRQTLPRHRFPICFLHLHIPPQQIDWNCHPAKAEIHLQQLDYWKQQSAEGIQQALDLSVPDTEAHPWASESAQQLIKTAEAQGFYALNRTLETAVQFEQSSESNESTHPVADSPQPLTPLRALAQLHNMYIVAEHPTGIWLIEQHIAHERVLYEQLQAHWKVVDLNPPITLSNLTDAQIEQLQQLEITVDPFGPHLWAIRSAPALLVQRQDCAEALIELSLGKNLQAALVAVACRSAIRNGTPLTLIQMQNLLDEWQQTRNPRTCPHGRPICLSLEESALSKFFRRHWVIGKSHGI